MNPIVVPISAPSAPSAPPAAAQDNTTSTSVAVTPMLIVLLVLGPVFLVLLSGILVVSVVKLYLQSVVGRVAHCSSTSRGLELTTTSTEHGGQLQERTQEPSPVVSADTEV